MKKIAVIIVPYELGRYRHGVGRGPDCLLAHGALAALASNGAAVSPRIVKLDDQFTASGSGEGDAAFEIIRLVADHVRQARMAGEFPVMLSGSCFPAVGVVAGMDETVPGVVWFDAHPDFSEPATTTSGYFDSMGLSVLTGSAWQAMLSTVPFAKAVPESSVVLAGARVFDKSEEVRLDASRIVHLTTAELSSSKTLVEAVRNLSPKITGLYIHIDLDVLDSAVAGVNVFGAAGGLDSDQLNGLVADLTRAFPIRAVALTAYDPASDLEARVPPIAQRILQTIARNL